MTNVKPEVDHKDGDETTVYKHPAYGMIGASRVQGSPRTLYGSDFDHNNSVILRIHTAELHRRLSNDHSFATGEIIEVELSETQWGSFVSSMNIGSGVQCTIRRFGKDRIPGIVRPDKVEHFRNELGDTMSDALGHLKILEDLINDLGVSKKKAEALMREIDMAKMNISNNVEFVADQFDEHIERTAAELKDEVNAYAVSKGVTFDMITDESGNESNDGED